MESVNWLKPKIDLEKVPMRFSAFLSALAVGALLFWPLQTLLWPGLAVITVLVLLVLILHRQWGLYWLATLGFFYGWELSFANYSWARNLNFLNQLNAPVVDFLAIIIFSYLVVLFILGLKKFPIGTGRVFKWPLIFYGLFLAWSLFTILFCYEREYGAAFKYWSRFMLFAPVFLLLPTWLAEKKSDLGKVLKIWLGVGTIVALFGLSSLLVLSSTGYARVAPYGIGNFSPLGNNHNMIAEALIALLPIGCLMAGRTNSFWRRWAFGAVGLMAISALLTLARAAWIGLAVEAMIFLYYYRDRVAVWFSRHGSSFILGLLFLGVAVYMLSFLGSDVVSSSNSARLENVKMSIFYARRSPWVGYGPGAYLALARDTSALVWEFGDPLEAHGFWLKILVEEGVVGLVLFSLFLWSVLKILGQKSLRSAPENQALARAVFIMAAGLMVYQIFDTTYFSGLFLLPLGVALAMAYKFE